MHQCIKQLINNKKKKGPAAEKGGQTADDLECLCQMLKTCGKKLDHEKAKVCPTTTTNTNMHSIMKLN